MKKKILIICILAILLASIVAVSAVIDRHEEKGVTYKVPNGFTLNNSNPAIQKIYGGYSESGTVYNYTNGTHNLKVYIYNLTNPSDSIDDIKDCIPDAEKTTINGVDGYIDYNRKDVTFHYIENGRYVKIKAPNKSIIEEMLSEGISSSSSPFNFNIPNISDIFNNIIP